MFARFDAALCAAGYLAMGGQIVDATIVAAPKQRNTEAERAAIKAGQIPECWTEKPDASSNPDFWDCDGCLVRGQSLCGGATDSASLMDVCRGAMVTGAAVPDPTPARARC